MLTPTADHLFDRGYISFGDDGAILVSPHIDTENIARFGIAAGDARGVAPFTAGQRAYLAYHRSVVFLA